MSHPDPRFGSIGIFDSGLGGLTVMRAIRELMPYENIIYFGDTARLPYGSKSAETILRYSLENASFLVKQGIKVLVIACNTACSAALDQVRDACEIPVVGITDQGVEEVSRLLPDGKVAILGTRATITSGIYQQQLLARCTTLELFAISCPLFVPLVEEGYNDHPMSALIVQEYLRPLKN
ncbi:MAG: glutamate racemase, partial [Candidatus Melainabacteria bacterium]|nr:glutamate racemase [Candidatus Melainabacteria bacterium]